MERKWVKMNSWYRWSRSDNFRCAVWIGLCFTLTSAIYLSWVHLLAEKSAGSLTEWISLVGGYLMQALGMAFTAFYCRGYRAFRFQRLFTPVILLMAVTSVTTLCSESFPMAILFGLVMNILFGVVSGVYLCVMSYRTDSDLFGLVFSGGYAAANTAVCLLSLVDGGNLIRSRYALLIYLPAAVLLLIFTGRLTVHAEPGKELYSRIEKKASEEIISDKIQHISGRRNMLKNQAAVQDGRYVRNLLLAGTGILLVSMVKNLGFSFPSEDIRNGLMPELSRLAYSIGLVTAGLIIDRKRKYGLICTIFALIVPFLMLSLSKEPVPGAILWILDYLFYGFVSVFRVVLFLDIARESGQWELAGLGLFAGRIGDTAGTAVNLILTAHNVALIAVTTLLFFPAVVLLFVIYQKLYEPEMPRQKSDQELFEEFCMQNDFSNREKQIFRLLADGSTNGEIAAVCFISENTVKFHVKNILQKTGCKNRIELQNKYYRYRNPL